MNPNPHLEQLFGLDDIPAVRSALSSRFPQFGQMKNGTSVSVAMAPFRDYALLCDGGMAKMSRQGG